jgi:ergothioneine biosynthesis protein EgtB
MSIARPVAEDRTRLLGRLAEARATTDAIFERIRPEALHERPIPERHRLIFYLGHLEAFDWNLLSEPLGLGRFNETYDKLFAFGIDPVDGGLPNEPPSAWPSEADVRAYNAAGRSALDRRLAEADFSSPGLEEGKRLHVAIEHRLMHAETLAYLLHRLSYRHKNAPLTPDPEPPGPAASAHGVRIPAGRATLGLARDAGFGWDNEFDEHVEEVPAFEIDALNVTNGEYLEFVKAGGYDQRELWGEAAWEWRSQLGIRHPAFWSARENGFVWLGMFGERELPLDWPVYVSLAEAEAYARWKGRSVPTEAQFHRAAFGTPNGDERPYPWGDEEPAARHGNFDFLRWEPAPAGSYPAGRSAFGVFDLLGNGWEWTRTPFAPFAGFAPFPFYRGYSADFFDGKHFVQKGGSPRTAACMLRRSFRNWFQPHYPYVYATFRLVNA